MAAELALDGSVRPVPGTIAMAERAGELGLDKIIVASESAAEAAMPAALGAHSCRVVPTRLPARSDPRRHARRARSLTARLRAGYRRPSSAWTSRSSVASPSSPSPRGCRGRRPRDADPRSAGSRKEPRRSAPADDHAAARRSRGDGGPAHRKRLRAERPERERPRASPPLTGRFARRITRSRRQGSSAAGTRRGRAK